MAELMNRGLTPAEDADLRCLMALAEVGELSAPQRARVAELLAKDGRSVVREPELYLELLPAQRAG